MGRVMEHIGLQKARPEEEENTKHRVQLCERERLRVRRTGKRDCGEQADGGRYGR